MIQARGMRSLPSKIYVHLIDIRGVENKDAISLSSSIECGGRLLIVDRDAVASEIHLRSSIMQAARSIVEGRSRARDRNMEVLRYLSGSRQVGEGVKWSGPGTDTEFIIAISLPEDWPSEEDARELPDIVTCQGIGLADPRMAPMEGVSLGSIWGGTGSKKFLMIAEGSDDERHLAILERTAMADHR